MAWSWSGATQGAVAGTAFGGPIGMGAGALLGGFFGGSSGGGDEASQSASSAYALNEQNISLARENMAWQERMANTAHQREVADLRAAGLNPILSATHGGAVTPSAIMPNLQNPNQNLASDRAQMNMMKMNSAKILSEVLLNRSLARTEKTKQDFNTAQADRAKATVGIPGWFQTSGKQVSKLLSSKTGQSVVSALGKALSSSNVNQV